MTISGRHVPSTQSPLTHCAPKLHGALAGSPWQVPALHTPEQQLQSVQMPWKQVTPGFLQQSQVSGLGANPTDAGHGNRQTPLQTSPVQVHVPASHTPLKHCSPNVHASSPFRPRHWPPVQSVEQH
jgi:hypothetical protein